MKHMLLVLSLVMGCDGAKVDDSSGDTDSGGSGSCNTDHEECAPGVSGCGGEGDNMLPGSDCLQCHDGSGGEDDRVVEEAPLWTAAGTLFSDLDGTEGVSGATVRITDSTGKTVELTTSSKGNFHTSKSLTPPLTAEVVTDAGTVSMSAPVDTGSCNSCHRCDGPPGGKMYAP